MLKQNFDEEMILKTINIAWESQGREIPFSETISLCEEMNKYANSFFKELKEGIL